MTVLPKITGRDEFAALIVRTAYDDEAAWQAVVTDLTRPWGDECEYDADVHIVDDPAWTGATPDDVLAAVRGDEDLSVVFLADKVTMQCAHRGLLALAVHDGEDDVDPMDGDPPPREFRTVPTGVHTVHANLSIANMYFEDYAETAFTDPDGVFRSFS
ncbi:hypothetical protein AB0K02_10515 [Streptomyces sp. NPDC049597]|uniref:DUF6924 domain-containing protein n=1 Tax=Streptomyces sp. NPDC049597 TaxID=3155276 RepID=UPI0034287570